MLSIYSDKDSPIKNEEVLDVRMSILIYNIDTILYDTFTIYLPPDFVHFHAIIHHRHSPDTLCN